MRLPTHQTIQTSPTQLWFAFWIQIPVCPVLLQNSKNGHAFGKRITESSGLNKLKIVCRRVIFRKFSVRCPHETTDGKVEPRRAKLSFIVTVRRKLDDVRWIAGISQHLSYGPIDLCIVLPALFVRYLSRITGACQNETVFDAGYPALIQAQPGNRTYCSGRKKESVGVLR